MGNKNLILIFLLLSIFFFLFFFFLSTQSFRINNKGEETSSDSAFLSLSFLSSFLRYLRLAAGWGVCDFTLAC